MQVSARNIFEGNDQDAHFYHLTNQPWRGPPPHSATANTPTDAAPPVTIPRYPQHPQHPGIRASAGHPVGTDIQLRTYDIDRQQDHQPGVLSQKSGI